MSRAMLYILKNIDSKRIKIGVTTDIDQRIKAIENSGGSKIELLYLSHSILNTFEVEKRLHKRFKNQRHIGEWFNIDQELAVNMAKSYIKEYGKEDNQIKEFREKREIIIPKISNDIEYEINYNLNINKYKRIKPGIYADKQGNLYSIKYRISDGGWMVSKLNRL